MFLLLDSNLDADRRDTPDEVLANAELLLPNSSFFFPESQPRLVIGVQTLHFD